MLIKNEDLYDLLNVKIGDKIKIINGGGYTRGRIFEIVENGKFVNAHCNIAHGLSRLIGVEFEKVKEYKRISLVSAVNRLSDNEDIFIKINNQYHTINYIEVMKDRVDVGYNDTPKKQSWVSHMGNESINNIAFYKEV